MSIVDYDIAVGNDDWYVPSSGPNVYNSTTLKAEYNSAIFPIYWTRAYGDIDTSSIGAGDTILAANLYLYLHAYTVSPARRGAPTKTYLVRMMKADESGYINIGTYTYTGAGWKTIVLSAAQVAEIDKGGKTQIIITVSNPGVGKGRTLWIRAWEYVTTDTFDMYLRVLFADAVPRKTLLGVGL